ncbi:MAG: sel1 repeat family protein [Alphaproteobacteria bacterium]|nr:MAG: sel1 repeat family protein [Alphaproteobacteria bacterium]
MYRFFALLFLILFTSHVARADAQQQLARYVQQLPQLKAGSAAGNASAQNTLGGLYEYGVGVGKSELEAVRLYRLAANQGFAQAQANLGRLYTLGKGVPKDDNEAAKWWNMAAGNGDQNAQLTMGKLYMAGQGVVGNSVDANFWLRVATLGKDTRIQQEAVQAMDKYRPHINWAEMQEAKQRAENWRPGMQQPLKQRGQSTTTAPSTQTLGDTDACAIYKSTSEVAYQSCLNSRR